MTAVGHDFYGYDSGGEDDDDDVHSEATIAIANSLRNSLLTRRSAAQDNAPDAWSLLSNVHESSASSNVSAHVTAARLQPDVAHAPAPSSSIGRSASADNNPGRRTQASVLPAQSRRMVGKHRSRLPPTGWRTPGQSRASSPEPVIYEEDEPADLHVASMELPTEASRDDLGGGWQAWSCQLDSRGRSGRNGRTAIPKTAVPKPTTVTQAVHTHSFDALDRTAAKERQRYLPTGRRGLGRNQRLAAALAACSSESPWHDGAPSPAPPAMRPMSAQADRSQRSFASNATITRSVDATTAGAPSPAPPAMRPMSAPADRSKCSSASNPTPVTSTTRSIDAAVAAAVEASVQGADEGSVELGPAIAGILVGAGIHGKARLGIAAAIEREARVAASAAAARVAASLPKKAATPRAFTSRSATPRAPMSRPASASSLQQSSSSGSLLARSLVRPPSQPRVGPPRPSGRPRPPQRPRSAARTRASSPADARTRASSPAGARTRASSPADARTRASSPAEARTRASSPADAAASESAAAMEWLSAEPRDPRSLQNVVAQTCNEQPTVKIEKVDWVKLVPPGSPQVEPQCAICLEAVTAGKDAGFGCASAAAVQMLGCGHAFHNGCISQWLSESPTCPKCRSNVEC